MSEGVKKVGEEGRERIPNASKFRVFRMQLRYTKRSEEGRGEELREDGEFEVYCSVLLHLKVERRGCTH